MKALVYFHHGRSLGHTRRALTLARAIAACPAVNNVLLVCGGEYPRHFQALQDFDLVQLPAMGPVPGTLFGGLHPLNLSGSNRRVLRLRQRLLETLVDRYAPRLLVTELFPFGRRWLRGEITALIVAARQRARRCCVVSSMRDVLGLASHKVTRGYRARLSRSAALFDQLWIHGDPTFLPLEYRFSSAVESRLRYTGYLDEGGRPARRRRGGRVPRIVIHAGGGKDAEALLDGSLAALARLGKTQRFAATLATGPFLPERAFRRLAGRAAALGAVELVRFEPDLRPRLAAADLSVSTCGYNTFLDLVQSGVPAVVVPRSAEPEQSLRAERWAALGGCVAVAKPQPAALHRAMVQALSSRPPPLAIDVGGAVQVTQIVGELLGQRSGPSRRRA